VALSAKENPGPRRPARKTVRRHGARRHYVSFFDQRGGGISLARTSSARITFFPIVHRRFCD
jgi:hypothetical protein